MLTVALTGGIASGKSIVADVLRKRSCYIHRSDETAREIMAPEGLAWKKIVSRHGASILNPDRTIDRAKLGRIIFNDPGEREFINRLIHPLVMDRIKETIARLAKEGSVKIFVSEAALTIEAGSAEFYDKVVVTYCPEDIQIQRLVERDGISLEEALRKIRAQMPAEEKLDFADYVIHTAGTTDETIAQAEDLYEELLLDYKIKCETTDNPASR
jgi:dephospho-CoA kinase